MSFALRFVTGTRVLCCRLPSCWRIERQYIDAEEERKRFGFVTLAGRVQTVGAC